MGSDKHVLVVGAGSVGKRHLRNLAALGCRVSAVDPREDRLAEAAATAELEASFSTLDAALENPRRYRGVVVCSPPIFHAEQAIAALRHGLPVFVEKPLCANSADAAEIVSTLSRTNGLLLLGYTYRWWEPLREVKRRIEQGSLGKILHVRGVMSAHLADWHPWEPYQDFFMASRELGGGALLDESHLLDLVMWLLGSPHEVFARVEKLSDLEIEADDNVDAWLGYPDGARVWLHLDLYGRPHERSLIAVGENGTIEWTFQPNRLRMSRGEDRNWEVVRYESDRNDMFVAAAKEFIQLLEGVLEEATCTASDGLRVLKVIDAMRHSAETGCVVQLR